MSIDLYKNVKSRINHRISFTDFPTISALSFLVFRHLFCIYLHDYNIKLCMINNTKFFFLYSIKLNHSYVAFKLSSMCSLAAILVFLLFLATVITRFSGLKCIFFVHRTKMYKARIKIP